MVQITLTLTDEQLDQVTSQFQQLFKESVLNVAEELAAAKQYPEILTKKEAKELLRIKSDKKMDELLNRPDFPVFRSVENGFPYFPYADLMAWVKKNTRCSEENKNYFKAI